MRHRLLLRAAAALVLPLIALAPLAAQARPDLRALDAYIARARADWAVPGLAVAVVKDGRVVLAKGYGVRHATEGGPVDEHTLFAIASNTKAFTTAALAMLVEEQKLTWDTPVRDVLPWFELQEPYAAREMRVRDLLSHRSGLGTFSGDLLWYGTGYSAEEVIRRTRHLPPASGFRERYGYSNLMFIAAGELLPALTGQRWDAFVRARILTPLGMSRTVTSVADLASRSNVAQPHAEKAGRIVPVDWYGWDAMGAAGGIISSAHDMARWIRLQLGRGTVDSLRLFTEAQSRTMWTPHMWIPVGAATERRFPSTHFLGYGLGWALRDYLGRKIVSHGGGYDGMFSQVTLVPEEGLGVVILTNAMTSVQTALTHRILDAWLGAPAQDWSGDYLARARADTTTERKRWLTWERERVADTRPSREPSAYAGTYGGALYGDARVEVEGGRLVLRLLPAPDLTADLTHWHFDTYRVQWRHTFPWFGDGLARFTLDQSGNVASLALDVPNDDFWFTELVLDRRP